ncbi:hypothetical protein COOONC_06933 [Cooperia oncophora]
MELRRTLESLGLRAITHTFTTEDSEEFGVNMLSIQRGPHYGTPNDKVVVVAANYDTKEGAPGVDDNGSGVAGVLETARTLATFDHVYGRLNTVIYAFFDMKHQMFPTAARELYEHQHMGDYIQVIGRERKDDDVLQKFFDAFYQSTARLTQDWSFQPWLLLLRLPMHTITSVDDIHR